MLEIEGIYADHAFLSPKCAQPFRDVAAFYSLPAGQKMPPAVTQDEFKCLNLVVSVPKTVLQQRAIAKVPVLIFIHGKPSVVSQELCRTADCLMAIQVELMPIPW